MRVAAEIALSKEERRRLESWATTRSTSVRLRERARIVLMAAQAMTNKEIAAELEVDANIGEHFIENAREEAERLDRRLPDRDLGWLDERTGVLDRYWEALTVARASRAIDVRLAPERTIYRSPPLLNPVRLGESVPLLPVRRRDQRHSQETGLKIGDW